MREELAFVACKTVGCEEEGLTTAAAKMGKFSIPFEWIAASRLLTTKRCHQPAIPSDSH